MKRLWVWGLLAASTAMADVTLRTGADNASTYVATAASCGVTLKVTWTYTPVGVVCTPLKLWSTSGTCGDAPGTDDVSYSSVTLSSAGSGSFDVRIADLPAFKDGSCGAQDVAHTQFVCGVLEYSTSVCGFGAQPKLQASLKIEYDTKPPTAPIVDDVVALSKAAQIHYTIDSDTASVIPQVRAEGEADFVSRDEVVPTSISGSVRVDGLVNGTTYQVQLVAKDKAGNTSAASTVRTVVPINTTGFWGTYRELGGQDQGGCTAAGGLWPLAPAVWLLRRRR